MIQKVIKVGNSIGFILPQAVRQDLDIKAGDTVLVEKRGREYVITSSKKKVAGGVDVKFMKMVDEFMEKHHDVLTELARR